MQGAEKFPGDVHLMLGIARVHEALNDLDTALTYHKKVGKIHANMQNTKVYFQFYTAIESFKCHFYSSVHVAFKKEINLSDVSLFTPFNRQSLR
jgi:hypothetical protein